MRMRILAAAGLALCLGASPGATALNPSELSAIGVVPPSDARVPNTLTLETPEGRMITMGEALAGRPALLLPFDPVCKSICGPARAILAGALAETGLSAGRDYRIVLLAIGNRDDAAARTAADAQAGLPADDVTVVWGPQAAVSEITRALGYRYAPDPDNDAVAHPAALFAITADGRVSRALSSLALNPDDLRLAIVEAGEGRVGALGDRLKLLCYGFDDAHGIYTASLTRLLQAGGIATILGLGGAILWMTRRRRVGGAAP